jgi:hypothetical protein
MSSRAVLGAATDYLNRATTTLEAAKNILDDPYLPEVTQIVLDLHKLEQPKALPPGAPAPPKVPGIGLKNVVTPLRAYRYTRQHKWVVPVAALAAIGLPLLFGYALGRRRR